MSKEIAVEAAIETPAPPGSCPPRVADDNTDSDVNGKIISLAGVTHAENELYMASSTPEWLDDKSNIDEILFADSFRKRRKIACIDGTLCDMKGIINEDDLRQVILHEIAPYVKRGAASKVDSLLRCLKIRARRPAPKHRENVVHLMNGSYIVGGKGFVPKKIVVPNRIPLNYDPNAPQPKRWLDFLNDLLEEEDIQTLQEYMGYLLIPSTKAQRMLAILGAGGEGKSRVGVILQNMLGTNAVPIKVSKLESSRFALSALENRLVGIDDELQMSGLGTTDTIKMLVTAAAPVEIEQKMQPARPAWLYARLLMFGNGNLTSLHDRSDGFYRRQIFLRAKERPEDRIDDPYLDEALKAEMNGILLWMLEGLEMLVKNDFKFTISEKTAANMRDNIEEDDSTISFLKSDYVDFASDAAESSKNLYWAYRAYCDENALVALKQQSFLKQLAMRSPKFKLHADKNIRVGSSVVRGYRGIRISGSVRVEQQHYEPIREPSILFDEDDCEDALAELEANS